VLYFVKKSDEPARTCQRGSRGATLAYAKLLPSARGQAGQYAPAKPTMRMRKLVDAWLPPPRILHPWPQQRFAVKHPRWEPYAGVPHVRIYAGGAR
jgi:hypothetical protein